MLIYGTKAPLRKTELIFEPCPNCKTANCIEINIFQKYLHLFWIPLVPLSKTGWSRCTNCDQVLTIFQMPPSLFSNYENIRKKATIPIWNFTGLFLVGIGIIALAVSDNKRHEKISRLIHSPKKDDVLEIMLDYNKYTLYKVKKVEKDSVYFFANKYEAADQKALDDLKSKGEIAYNSSTTYGIPIKRLIDMNEDDKIVDIDRK